MKRILFAAVAVLLATPWSAEAALNRGDFFSVGDGLSVTDSTTALQYLTPGFTKNRTFNDATVQSLISTYGLRYATAAEVRDMINNNFGNPPVGSPGNAAGFAAAQDFFNLFGINLDTSCLGGAVLCPRTQGLTATVPSAGAHTAVGMIQFGPDGWLIDDNPWSDSVADTQMGSWLVRSTLDSDADGALDVIDNCTLLANPTQLDADADGYGNACDADLNNSGTVTTADFGILRSVLNQAAGSSATAAAADLNESGTVTTADFAILRARLNTAPGPSGLHP